MRHLVRGSLRLLATIPLVAVLAPLPAAATGWTWVNPSPTGAFLYAVSQSVTGDVFVLGADGTASRKTAAGWQPLFCERAVDAFASVATLDGAVFAAGPELGGTSAVLLRWNGTSFSAVAETGTVVRALWASSARDAWMGGGDPATGDALVLRWDGGTLVRMVVAPGLGLPVGFLWGSSPSDVWAGVSGHETPRLFHYDGKTWSEEDLGRVPDDANTIVGLHGSGPGRPILVVTEDPADVAHARVWRKEPSGWVLATDVVGMEPKAVSGTPDGTVAISGYRTGYVPRVVVGKGESWTEEDPGTREILTTLSGTPDNGFLGIGQYDTVFARTPSRWVELVPRRMDDFTGVARQPDGSLLLWGRNVVTKEGLVVRRETDGRFTTVVTESAAELFNVRTGPDGVVWAVGASARGGYGFVYRSVDGRTFTKDLQTPAGELELFDVLPEAGGVRAVGVEAESHGPFGEAPVHVLTRAADGTWADELVTADPHVDVRFIGGMASPTVMAFDPAAGSGTTGATRVHVRDATGWHPRALLGAVTLKKDVAAGGGRALLPGHDNSTMGGVLCTWDGNELAVAASASASETGGMLFLEDAAVAGAGALVLGSGLSSGSLLFSWDGASSELVVAGRAPAVFAALDVVSPTEVWLSGGLGRLMRFDGGGDLRAGRTPGVTVMQARHRPTVAADLAGWYGIPLSRVASDVMDAVATVPAGGRVELQFTWVPDRAIPASLLRLWTVDEGSAARMLHLDPGAWPMPAGGFELVDPSGRSLDRAATLAAGTAYTVRFTLEDGGFASFHDLDPRPGLLRTSVVLTTY